MLRMAARNEFALVRGADARVRAGPQVRLPDGRVNAVNMFPGVRRAGLHGHAGRTSSTKGRMTSTVRNCARRKARLEAVNRFLRNYALDIPRS
jgi:hypothetical protein